MPSLRKGEGIFLLVDEVLFLPHFLVLCCLLFAVGCADRKEQILAQLAELEWQNIADT